VVVQNAEAYAVSPGSNPTLAVFIPPHKGNPALIQLRTLPDIDTILYTKTSFNADTCAMRWNSKGKSASLLTCISTLGTAFLATASVDVDKTGRSYYGTNLLYCILARKSDDSFQVHLDKQGPIYSHEWSPTSTSFCVCYGYMPSKVSAVFLLLISTL
jgi:translation initiation factor 2A